LQQHSLTYTTREKFSHKKHGVYTKRSAKDIISNSTAVMGNLFTIRATWIVHYRWRAANSIDFIPKLYLFLSEYLLITELRLDAILYFNLGNKNSNEGHIKCSWEAQVPYPCSRI